MEETVTHLYSEQKKNRLFRFFRILFVFCFVCSMGAILFFCEYQLTVLMFIMGALISAAAWLSYRYSVPRAALTIFILSFAVTVLIVLTIQTPIDNDFAIQYEAAQKFRVGDMSFGMEPYFQSFPHLNGLSIVEGFFLKIWNNPLFLKLINCLLTAGVNVIIYLIAKEFFSEKAARSASICYLLFGFPTIYVTVLSNQTYSNFTIYLGFYLLISSKIANRMPDYIQYGLSAFIIAIGNAIRPEGITIAVSVGAYLFFLLIQRFTLKNFLSVLKRTVVFFGVLFVFSTLFSNAVKWAGISQYGLENRAVFYKFVIGLNFDSSGTLNGSDTGLVEDIMNTEGISQDEASLKIVKERLITSPVRLVELAKKKIDIFWWDSVDRYLVYPLGHIAETYPQIYSLLTRMSQLMFFWIFLLANLGFLTSWKRYKNDIRYYLMPFMIFTVFTIYLFIEIQSKYSYIVHPAFFILAAGGIELMMRIGEKGWRKIKKIAS